MVQSDLEKLQQRQLSGQHSKLRVLPTRTAPAKKDKCIYIPASGLVRASSLICTSFQALEVSRSLQRDVSPPQINPNSFPQLTALLSTHNKNPTPREDWVPPLPMHTPLHITLSVQAQPSSKHQVFWGKLPRKPNVTWPTGCVLQVGPREASASLSESSHPRRGSVWRRVPSAKRAQPFSSNAGGSTKAPLLSSLLKRRGINLLLFLPNDTPESYRALATQLSITGSQGGAKTQGKPMEAQGKYITPGQLQRAQPSGEQIGVQVERFIWRRLQLSGNHAKADK